MKIWDMVINRLECLGILIIYIGGFSTGVSVAMVLFFQENLVADPTLLFKTMLLFIGGVCSVWVGLCLFLGGMFFTSPRE